MNQKQIEVDVLVVGGGLAGMRAAIEAKAQGAKVLVAIKGKLGRMSAAVSAYHGAGVGPWGDPDDRKELHLKDVIKAGGYLADQELCKIMIDELADRLIELERFGLYWERDDKGHIAPYLGSGHSKPRTISTWLRQGGLGMIQALKLEILRKEIPVLEDTMVTKLLVNDGVVTGAMGLEYVNGEFVCIRARATIIATGAHSEVFPANTTPPEGTGDGPAMAYHAGAELMNMEHVVYVGTMDHPNVWRSMLVPTLFKVGGDTLHLLNKHGERFMERYDPEHLEMAAKDIIASSIQREIKGGRGGADGDTFYADLRHLPYEEARQKLLDLVVCMEKMGLDVRKDLVPFRPAAHETLGGVRINAECESTIPGLYAAGSAIGAIYGNDGIPGRGTGHALVFGKRAGEYGGKRALGVAVPSTESKQVEAERKRIFDVLDHTEGIRPIKALRKLQDIMGRHFGAVKSEAGLEEALREVLRMREEDFPQLALSSCTRRFNLEWRRALEMGNLIDVSEMMIRSAMMRKETRTMFMREDYPERDDTNWLKHIVVKKESDQMDVDAIPIELTYLRPEND